MRHYFCKLIKCVIFDLSLTLLDYLVIVAYLSSVSRFIYSRNYGKKAHVNSSMNGSCESFVKIFTSANFFFFQLIKCVVDVYI